MSHTSKISKIRITDIAALKAAVQDLNKLGIKCSLLENVKPRAFYDTQQGMGTAPYVLRLDDCAYDVGFYNDENSKVYEPRTDLFGDKVRSLIGVSGSEPQDHIGKLLNAYSAQAAIRQAISKGYQAQRVYGSDGLTEKVLITVSS